MAFTSYPWSNVHELNLDFLIRQLKELEKHVAEFDEARKEFEKVAEELREQMAQMTTEIDDLEKLYSDFVTQVEAKFENLRKSLYDDFALFEQEVRGQLHDFQTEVDDLEATLEHVLNNLPSEIKMINPVTGELDNLENIINALAGQSKTEALTATEYDALALTASAYDAYGLTAYEYDWEGKTLLV